MDVDGERSAGRGRAAQPPPTAAGATDGVIIHHVFPRSSGHVNRLSCL